MIAVKSWLSGTSPASIRAGRRCLDSVIRIQPAVCMDSVCDRGRVLFAVRTSESIDSTDNVLVLSLTHENCREIINQLTLAMRQL